MNLKSMILNLCRCCKRDGIYVLGNNNNNLFSLFDIDTLTTYIVFPTVLESVGILRLGDIAELTTIYFYARGYSRY